MAATPVFFEKLYSVNGFGVLSMVRNKRLSQLSIFLTNNELV